MWTKFSHFLFLFLFRDNCRKLFTSGILTEFAQAKMLCLQVGAQWWCTSYPNFLVPEYLKEVSQQKIEACREDRIPVMIQCLTSAALPWQKTVFIHPPFQRKPLSFTCSYVLTYKLKFNGHNLLYWIKWLDVSLLIRVENVMDHEFHCKGYCVQTVNNCELFTNGDLPFMICISSFYCYPDLGESET